MRKRTESFTNSNAGMPLLTRCKRKTSIFQSQTPSNETINEALKEKEVLTTLASSNTSDIGRERAIEHQNRKQQIIYDYSNYFIFANGVAAIVVEKTKKPKPPSPNRHLPFSANG